MPAATAPRRGLRAAQRGRGRHAGSHGTASGCNATVGVCASMQWIVVVVYAVLVVVPAFLPLAGRRRARADNLTIFAQWMFWGLWWPFVILSMFVAGRTWCGVFCPEGTLTEAASRFGLHRAVPRWLRWAGWPFVAFALTTVFGQLVSVYQYPQAVLLVLGGSTLAAIGRRLRVRPREACVVPPPVPGERRVRRTRASGADALPRRPRTVGDERGPHQRASGQLRAHGAHPAHDRRRRSVTCAAAAAAISTRCGLRAALPIARCPRCPRARPRVWDALLIVTGLIGIAIGAFQWSASPWFVQMKLAAAAYIVDHGPAWLLADNAPWWLLTHYPEVNDVFTWLDGAMIVGLHPGRRARAVGRGLRVARARRACAAGSARRADVAPVLRADSAGGFRRVPRLVEPHGDAREGRGHRTGVGAGPARAGTRVRRGMEPVAVLESCSPNPPSLPRRAAAWCACALAVAAVVAAWSMLFFVWGAGK